MQSLSVIKLSFKCSKHIVLPTIFDCHILLLKRLYKAEIAQYKKNVDI